MWQQWKNRENFVLIKGWWITYDVQRVYWKVACSKHYHYGYKHFWSFSSCSKLAHSCWIWLSVAKIYFVYFQKRKNSFRFSSKVQLKKRAKAGLDQPWIWKFTSIIAKLLSFYITVSWNRIWSPKNPHDLKVGDCHQNQGKPKEEKGKVKKFSMQKLLCVACQRGRGVHSRVQKDSFDYVEILLGFYIPCRDTLSEKLDVEAKRFFCEVQNQKFW